MEKAGDSLRSFKGWQDLLPMGKAFRNQSKVELQKGSYVT